MKHKPTKKNETLIHPSSIYPSIHPCTDPSIIHPSIHGCQGARFELVLIRLDEDGSLPPRTSSFLINITGKFFMNLITSNSWFYPFESGQLRPVRLGLGGATSTSIWFQNVLTPQRTSFPTSSHSLSPPPALGIINPLCACGFGCSGPFL